MEISDLLGRVIISKSINIKDKELSISTLQLSTANYIINLKGKGGLFQNNL